ncbi:hypothetical protein DFH09DRAFT_1138109, partial [Mycena vulgaris]
MPGRRGVGGREPGAAWFLGVRLSIPVLGTSILQAAAVRLGVFACGPRGKRHGGGSESEGRGKGCGGDEASAGGSLVRP